MTAFIFRFYRALISPAIQLAFGVGCRYEESCSRFTERMIRERGMLRGVVRGAARLLKCNQFWRENG